MPASEEHVHGGNKEKTRKGSPKRPNKQEELTNGPVNHQLDFEVSVMQRVSGGGGDSFPNNCGLVVL